MNDCEKDNTRIVKMQYTIFVSFIPNIYEITLLCTTREIYTEFFRKKRNSADVKFLLI